ncbi:MAG: tRNA (adenosine(37)-N6)-threonylcarbamoyltransferase complex ATPase subunit type 1 TsaE [Gemmataceae bacterium]
MAVTLQIADADAMTELGRAIASQLFPGAVLALNGPMGAGKTFLTRAIAEALHVAEPSAVNSPTFVLIQEYDADLPIYHFDAYRLNTEAEFRDLGVHEYFAAGGVCIVEWADKFPQALPAERLEIRIEPTSADSRTVTLEAFGDGCQSVVEAVTSRF